jgi:membrane-bound lytic murein transglycosylase A
MNLPSLLPMLAMVLLASCVPKPRPSEPLAPPTATPAPEPKPLTAAVLGVTQGPSLPALDAAAANRSLEAFRISCPSLLKRTDASGLTRPEDWQEACSAAGRGDIASPSAFFAEHFETIQVGDGAAFVTGYYERSEIEAGALAGRGLEIAWAADAIDLFFLQIQGSGRLRLPDGGVMRIGYAGQNGREYVGIGKLMKDRGLLGTGPTTMQALVAWLRANPEEGLAIMRENKSYVFFQELTGPGPLGALGLPVTGQATVAADPKFVPLGAPVLLQLDRPEASGLWVAQDTGGAIRGANRFDTFWGAGADAARIAGGMQGKGRAYLLVPKGTLARLHATPQP